MTTPDIARAFDNGMEFFSTFGGNNVSCAVGIAVLDVLESEGFQTKAFETGQYLLAEFKKLKSCYELIGDVRGSGLFLGIELVRDRQSLAPAATEAEFVVNRMRDLGVLSWDRWSAAQRHQNPPADDIRNFRSDIVGCGSRAVFPDDAPNCRVGTAGRADYGTKG